MKREELRAIVAGITNGQLEQILNINSADVQKVKNRLQPQISSLKQQVAQAEATIAALEASQKNAGPRRGRCQRPQPTGKAAARKRFSAAAGGGYAKSGALNAFARAGGAGRRRVPRGQEARLLSGVFWLGPTATGRKGAKQIVEVQ